MGSQKRQQMLNSGINRANDLVNKVKAYTGLLDKSVVSVEKIALDYINGAIPGLWRIQKQKNSEKTSFYITSILNFPHYNKYYSYKITFFKLISYKCCIQLNTIYFYKTFTYKVY